MNPTLLIKQFARFGFVGLLNTATDFLIFNIAFLVLHFPLLLANIVATSIAMVLSLQLNRKFVFMQQGHSYVRQAIKFISVTLFGLYFIQNAVIIACLHMFETLSFFDFLPVDRALRVNAAKIVGVGFTLIWNFTLYKTWVFRNESIDSDEENLADV